MGHVRDLPSSGLGVDIENDFEPTYEVPDSKATVVKNLKAALKEVDDLWIATDEDREGEAIGWHLLQVLKVKNPSQTKRIVFHEITQEAIEAAIKNPRNMDEKLVDAQQARRILDRLVGYTLSPFLWKKVYSGLSAGRVQSVAVKIIVDREREIQAFNAVEYWSLEALLENGAKQQFSAFLDKKKGEKIEIGNKDQIDTVLKDIEGKDFVVSDKEEKEVQRNPAAPFTTSTLQQEASRKLGFSVKQTMVVAQQLYEGVSLGKGEGSAGLITYMRTDSVNLSEKALGDAKMTIEKLYGREYVIAEPRKYKTKAKGAQEAHEAIRPTELSRTPDSLADVLDHQQLKLYTLIWNRTLATQMPPAEFKRVAADIAVADYSFRATGQTMLFDGFMRVYLEGRDDEDAPNEDGEKILPPLSVGEKLGVQELKPEQHFTKPPARYTEASLVKKMEEEGIGRPSTYAPTISTIQQRGYIRKEAKQLVPEDIAFTVTDLLAEHFPDIVNLAFTAGMEQSLDDIAEGNKKGNVFLKEFFTPFKDLVDSKTKEIKKSDVLKERVVGMDPATGLEVIARMGRFGAYVQLGRFAPADETGKRKKVKKGEGPKTASLPKNISVDAATLEQALSLLQFPRMLGIHDGEPLQVLLGRFGPYMKCGTQTVALPKDADPTTVTFDQAIQFMKDAKERKATAALPLRVLGNDKNGTEITVKSGRYGPYVTDGKTNASVPKKSSPDTITLEEAEALLEKKRTSPPRKWNRKKKE